PAAGRALRVRRRDAAARDRTGSAHAVQGLVARGWTQGTAPAVSTLACDLWEGRRVRPVGRGRLHQAVGDGRSHLGTGPGTAARARAGQPARRREEAHAIGKLWGARV